MVSLSFFVEMEQHAASLVLDKIWLFERAGFS